MKKKFARKTFLLSAIAVLLVGSAVFAITQLNNPNGKVDNPKQVSTKEARDSTASATPESEAQQSPSSNLPVISKPMLGKSSGNNGPVPAKANIEFSCTGMLNASCFVVLTNQNDPSDNLKFDAKTITDDGHGNTSVTWVWEAKAGTWTVKATQSSNGYQSNTSDPQTLTVSS